VELVVVARVSDLSNHAHVQEIIVVSLDAQGVQDDVLDAVVVAQDCQVLDVLLDRVIIVLVLVAVLVVEFIIMAGDDGV
jgi:hypothetical protein